MYFESPNRPYVVWSSWILWAISIFSVIWSLILFFYVSDMLILTGTDLVNAIVLLSGIIMLPMNVYIVYSVANGQKVECTAKVLCCRLWMSIVWIIIINFIGVILCIRRIYLCQIVTNNDLYSSMQHYKTAPKHKHFVDNMQWALGCCGVKSYSDWFTRDWHDKERDFDWSSVSERSVNATPPKEIDSVPLSCCKSGSCVSSYLKELGTYSINTKGCGFLMYRIIMISMNAHLVMFVIVIVLEAFLLRHLMLRKNEPEIFSTGIGTKCNVDNIMSVNDNFEISSGSYQMYEDESDDIETSRYRKNHNEN